MYKVSCEDILLFEQMLTEGLLGAGISKLQKRGQRPLTSWGHRPGCSENMEHGKGKQVKVGGLGSYVG